ncbi:hypothetical protein DJ533_02660 [Acinetobacter defluvii]|uniref:Autotransporter adhesin n=1 Tax=Acinetobacter defluvii TaxID=1871111 RepID=A0A2S2F9V6_9GAMM|nr:ESPR-type extended signal peptide-containing protein [Acinetobacter defluvii]AWL27575.1 hypothetical protein DJ533_02660 [Acinetobacter defluvii]
MNKIYKVIWNTTLGAWVAVSEITKGKGKTKSGVKNIQKLSILPCNHQIFNKILYINILSFSISVVFSSSVLAGALDGGSVYLNCNPTDSNGSGWAGTAGQSVAIGTYACAPGDQALAIGANTYAKGNSSISIGGDDLNKVAGESNNTVAAQTYKKLTGDNLIANYDGKTGVGHQYINTESGNGAVALGVQSTAKGDLATAFGTRTNAQGIASVALGVGSYASKDGSVALGAGSTTATNASKVTEAKINGVNFLNFAGGTNFAGDASDTGRQVSVGNVGNERQIKNVAAGAISATSTDALNGSQVYAVTNTLIDQIQLTKSTSPIVYTDVLGNKVTKANDGKWYSSSSVDAGGNKIGSPTEVLASNISTRLQDANGSTKNSIELKNVKAGDLSAVSTDAVNGSQLFTTNQNVATNTTNITKNAGDITNLQNQTWKLQANGDGASAVKASDTVQFLNGTNVEIKRNGNDITIGSVAKPVYDSITVNNAPTDGTDVTNKTYVDGKVQTVTNTPLTFVGDDATVKVDRKLGETLQIDGGATGTLTDNNIGVVADATNNKLTVKLAEELKDLKSVTTGTGSDKTVLNKDGLTVTEGTSNTTIGADSITVGAGAGKNPVTINGTAGTVNGLTNKTWNGTAVSGQAATEDQLKTVSDVANNANQGWKVNTAQTGTGTATGSASSQVKPGDEVKFTAGNNIAITQNGKDLTIATNPNLVSTSITTGNSKLENGGLTINNTDPAKVVKVTDTGISAGGQQITNVASGGSTGTNAANIDDVTTAVTNLGNKPLSFVGDDATVKVDRKLGETLQIDGGATGALTDNNIGVVADTTNNKLTVKLAEELKDLKSVTTGTGSDKTVLNKDGLTVTEGTSNTTIGADSITVGAGAGKNPVTINGTAGTINGLTNKTWNGTAVSGQAATEDQLKTVSDVANNANQGWQVNTAQTGTGTATGSASSQVKPGEEVKFTAGNNIAITQNGKDLTIATNPNLVSTSITTGNSKLENGGLTINNTDPAKVVKVTDTGISAGGQQITNVASGGSTGTNAANIDDVTTAVTNLGNKPLSFVGDDATVKVDRKLGETLQIDGGATGTLTDNNIGVVADTTNNKLTVKLAEELKDLKSVTTGTGSDKTVLNKDGLTVTEGTSNTTIGADSITVGAGAGKNPVTINGTAGTINGLTNKTWNGTAVSGQAATEDQLKTVSDVANNANQGWQVNTAQTGTGTATGSASSQVKPGEEVKFTAGNNIAITQNGKDLTIATNPNLVSTSITTGNSKLENGGLTINNTDPAKVVKVTDTGISAGGQQITNVASGGSTGTNAANIDDVTTAVTNLGNKPLSFVGDDATVKVDRKLGETLQIDGGATGTLTDNNIGVVADTTNNKLTVKLAEELKDLKSVTTGTGSDKTVLNKDGLTVTEGTSNTTIGADSITVGAGAGKNPVTINGTAGTINGLTNKTWNGTAVSGQAATEDQLKTVSDVANNANQGWQVNTAQTGTGTATGSASSQVKPGEEVKFTAGNNIAITQNGKDLTIATNPNLVSTSITTGNSKLENGGLTINNTDPAKVVKVTDTGISAGGQQITNVASGGSTGTNAANIDDVTTAVTNLGNKPLSFVGDDATVKVDRKLGETLQIDGGATGTLTDNNIGVVADTTNNKLTVKLAEELKDLKSVTTGTGSDKTVLNKDGLTVTEGTSNTTIGADSITVGAGAGKNPVTINGTAGTINGLTNKTWNGTAVSGQAATEDQLKTVSDVANNANQGWQVNTAQTGTGTATGSASSQVKPGEEVKFTAGNNIAITQNGKDLTIATNPNLVSTSITTGNSKLENGGLTINNTDPAKVVKVTDTGISAGGQQITNVASGGSTGTNAANIDDVTTAVTNLGNKPLSFVGDDATVKVDRKLGETLQIDGGATGTLTDNNIGVVADTTNNKLTVKLAEELKDLKSVTTGTGSDKTVLNKDGLTVTEGTSNTTIGADSITVGAGAGKNPVTINGTAGTINGLTNKTWNGTAVSGQAATEDQLKTVSDVANNANQGWQVNTAQTGTGTATGSASSQVKPGEEVKFTAGNNIAITQNGKDLTIATNPNLVSTSITTGNSKLENGGLTINNTDPAKVVKVTDTGISAGGQQITNVASGGSTGTNAANIDDVTTAVTNLGNKPLSFVGDDATVKVDRKLGETLQIDGGATGTLTDNNIGVVADTTNNKLTVKLAEELKDLKSVTTGTGSDKTVLNKDGLTVTEGTSNTTIGADSITVGAGAGKNPVTINGTAGTINGLTNKTWNGTAVSGQAATEDQLKTVSDVANNANQGWQVNTAQTGTGTATGSASSQVKPGEEVKFTAGNNIAITQNGKDLTIATNPNLVSTSITTGNSKLENGGLTINNTDPAKVVKVTDTGISAGGQQITNVASGGSTGTNAANIDDVTTAVTNLGNKPLSFVGDDATVKVDRKLGETLQIDGGATGTLTDNNIGVVADTTNNKLTVKLAEELKDLKSVTTGTGSDKTVLNKDGLTVTEGSKVTTIGEGNVQVSNGTNTLALDATKGTLEGLTNKDLKVTDFATQGRAATEEQLNAAQGSTSTIIGGGVTNNAGNITGPFTTNGGSYNTIAEAIEDQAKKSKTTVSEGDNITVTSTTNADGSTDYSVATKKDVKFDKVTVGNVVTDSKTNTITGVEAGSIGAGSKDVVNGSQIHDLVGKDAYVDNKGNVTNTVQNIGGTGATNIDDAIKNVNTTAKAAKTEVKQGDNITVSEVKGKDGQSIYTVATAKDVNFDKVTVGNVVTDATTNKISGLADGTVAKGSTEAITGNQLNTAQDSTKNIIGGGVTNNAGNITGPFTTNGGSYNTIAEAIEDQAKKSKTTVSEGDNITVTSTTNADGSTDYNVATKKDVKFDKVTVGNVVTDSKTNTITGVEAGSIGAGSKDVVNGSQIHDLVGKDAYVDNKGNVTNTVQNIGGTGATNIDDAIKNVNTTAKAAKTEVKQGDNITVSEVKGKDGQSIYTVATAKDVNFDKVTVGNVVTDATTNKISGLADGTVAKGSTEAITGNQLNTAQDSTKNIIGGGVTNNAGNITGPFTTNGGSYNTIAEAIEDQAKKSKTTVSEGDNITVTSTTNADGSTDYNVATKKDVKFDKVTVGNVVTDSKTNTITGVEAGSIGAGSKDVVNGSQIHDLVGKDAYVDNKGNVTNTVQNIGGTGATNIDDAIKNVNTTAKAAKTEVKQGDNITVSEVKGKDGQSIYTVATAKDVNFDKVTVGNVVTDATTNKISGLADGTVAKGSTEAITGNQLNTAQDSTKNIIGGGVTNNAGNITGPFTTNGGSYNTIAEAIEDQAKKSKTTVSEGDNITVTSTTNADGSTDYNVATKKDVKFDKVTVGNVVTDSKTNTITGVEAGSIGAGSKDVVNGSQIHDLVGKDAYVDNKGNVTNTVQNIGGTGATNIDDAIKNVNTTAKAAKTEVKQGDNITVSEVKGKDGQSIYTVATAKDVNFDKVTVGNVVTDATTNKISGLADGTVAKGSTEAITGNQLNTAQDSTKNIIGGGVTNNAGNITGPFTTNGGSYNTIAEAIEDQAKKSKTTVSEGDNITVTSTTNADGSTDYNVATKKDVKFDKVTVGNVVTDSKTNTITGVEAGSIGAGSKDVVNGSQIHDLVGKDAYVDNKGNVTNTVQNIGGTGATNIDDAIKNVNTTAKAAKTEVKQGDNITVSEVKGKDGQSIYTVATAKDVNFDKVTVGNVVTDATTNKISGLADGTVAKGSTEAITGNQLNTAQDSTKNIIGGGVTNNAGNITGPFTTNGGSYNTIAEAIEDQAKKSKTTVSEGDNITVTSTTNADGSTDYNVATKKDVKFDKVTVGNVVTDSKTNTITGVEAGSIGAGSKDVVNGSQIHDLVGKDAYVDNKGNVTNTVQNIGGTGATNIDDAIKNVNTAANKAKTTVTAGDNITVTSGTNADGSTNYAVATAKNVNFDQVKVGNVSISNKGIDAGNTQIKNVAAGTADTDAVNVNQLNKVLNQKIENDVTNIIGTTDGKPSQLFETYNVSGQQTTDRRNIAETVTNINTKGAKYFHTNAVDEQVEGGVIGQTNDSSAAGKNSTAIGVNAIIADGATSTVAVGHNTQASAQATDSVVVGSGSKVGGISTIAIGHGAQALGNQSISIGTGNIVKGNNSGALGDPSTVDGNNSYSVGNNNTVKTDNTFVLGNDVTQTVEGSVVLGNKSAATTGANVAGYALAQATADDRDAIKKTTSTTGAVAVGDASKAIYRQITGVAAGTANSDAVNVAQLKAVDHQVTTTQQSLVDSLGGGAKVDQQNGTITGPTYNVGGGTQSNVGDALDALNKAVTNVDTTANAGWTVKAGDKSQTIKPKASVEFVGDNNVTVTQENDDKDGNAKLAVQLNKKLDIEQLKAGDTIINTGGVSIGQAVQLGGTGLVIKNGPSVTTAGINAGNKVITNVAAGQKDNDAVNKGQLDNAITNINNKVDQANNNAVQYDKNTDGTVNKGSVTLGGGDKGTTLTNVADGKVAQGSKDAVNGGQLWNIEQKVNQNTTDISNIKNEINNGSLGLVQQTGGSKADITVGKNTGGTTVNMAGKDGDRVITGVKDGAINATSKDAINGSQLHAQKVETNQKVVEYLGGGAAIDNITGSFTQAPSYTVGDSKYNNVGGAIDALNKADQELGNKINQVSNNLEQAFYSTNQRIDDVEKRANAGIAAAMSLENAPYIPGKYTYAAGAAYHGGESAIGVTLRKTADNGRWSLTGGIAAASEGDPSVRIGISGVID